MLKIWRKAMISKKMVTLVIIAVLSVSLAGIAVTVAEEFGGCENCHMDIADDFTTSLHYTGAGMKGEYEVGAAEEFGIDMDVYYSDWNCANCHATTCDKCHVNYTASYPGGHKFTEVGMEACDKCHFKKQTSTFVGDVLAHNNIPVEGPETFHPPDIHYVIGFTCTDCHTEEEMHGTGVEHATMLEAVTVQCEDCHMSPGKTVNGMTVEQFSTDVPAHEIHEDKLSCAACHAGWMPTCVNCHLETRKGTKVVIDDFHLAIAADGKIKPFINMTAIYDNATHVGYGEWMPHTISPKAKDCAFCHDNPEALCAGCEGQMLGEGGSFIPQDKIEAILAVEVPAEAEMPEPTPPGFELIFAVIAIAVVVYIAKRRIC
jgi:hypothetical protein